MTVKISAQDSNLADVNMRHYISRYSAFILLFLFCGYSFGQSTVTTSCGNHCPFLVVYYPFRVTRFPDVSSKAPFTPVPEYDGWSVDRIDRDMSRISKSGLNGVLLAIEPSDLNDSHKLDMIRTFLAIASNLRSFNVAFLFAPSRFTQLSRSNVSSFLKRKGLLNYSSVYRYSDNYVIFFSDNVELVAMPKPDFLYIRLDLSGSSFKDAKNSPGLIAYPSTSSQSEDTLSNYRVMHIFAGLVNLSNNKYQWIVSRRNGQCFQNNLDNVLKSSTELVVISSWNDYAQGSAIENNSLDNTLMIEILMKFIKKSN